MDDADVSSCIPPGLLPAEGRKAAVKNSGNCGPSHWQLVIACYAISRASERALYGRLWPVADAAVAGPMVRNLSEFGHQSQPRLTVVGGATVARTRRPLPRKAAVAADMLRRLYLMWWTAPATGIEVP